ncbi:MAG: FprA family A-type flavoprotein [Deltaproteobacteria bacterium]|nr:FprA family A-type flavoprotein [Deltaproteobacteria bacterium]
MHELKKGIYWVGGIDWNIRNFHGYATENGTTYNAFLVVDEKIALIDTVKSTVASQLISRIKRIIDPSRIDYIVSNHTEMDHSGAISDILEYCPDATIISSKVGEKGLRQHFKKEWNFQVVKTGDTVSLGKNTLTFINTPMVHWPDSMVTYIPEARILFSNDAFGQHLASAEHFDDEIGWTCVRKYAAKYYANIVTPFGKQVSKALAGVSGLDIEMICPSHGVIWRSYISRIIEDYGKWAAHETLNKAVIIYDTMWNSTEQLAFSLEQGLENAGVSCTVRNLRHNHISDIMTDILDAKMVLLGCPTLNNTLLPTMGQFLTYLRGLKPQNRLGFAFGSYGWGGQAVKELEAAMEELKWEQPLKGLKVEYVPDELDLSEAVKNGEKLGSMIS